jgi:hypothetical protein
MTFTEVQEVLFCKAFGPSVFAAVRCDSEYLLTETLTFSMSFIASRAELSKSKG